MKEAGEGTEQHPCDAQTTRYNVENIGDIAHGKAAGPTPRRRLREENA